MRVVQSRSQLLVLTCTNTRNIHLPHQRNVYWDGGPAKIEAFLEQHVPMCEDNWVCTRLGLRQIVVEDDTSSDTELEANHSPMSSPTRSDKQSVLHSQASRTSSFFDVVL